jgi:proteasome accessory factor C
MDPLREKIYQHSTLLPLANQLIDQYQSELVARLAEAIRNRR